MDQEKILSLIQLQSLFQIYEKIPLSLCILSPRKISCSSLFMGTFLRPLKDFGVGVGVTNSYLFCTYPRICVHTHISKFGKQLWGYRNVSPLKCDLRASCGVNSILGVSLKIIVFLNYHNFGESLQ